MKTSKINMEKNFISNVIYLRDAEDSIQDFLIELDSVFSDKFESYEYILVNDNSHDSSVKIVNDIKNIKGNISLVNLAWKHGLEGMQAGVDLAIGDFVFEFDSTVMNYDKGLIMDVYHKCLEGYDIVAATDDKTTILSRLFYFTLSKMSYRKMKISNETFRVISRRAINRVSEYKERRRFKKALYHYLGLETTVIKYSPINDNRVKNNLTMREKIDILSEVFVSYSDIGSRLANIFLFTSVVMSILKFIDTVAKISTSMATSTIFDFTLGFFYLAVGLTIYILLKYLSIMLSEIYKRPAYTFKSVEKIKNKK